MSSGGRSYELGVRRGVTWPSITPLEADAPSLGPSGTRSELLRGSFNLWFGRYDGISGPGA